MQTVYEKRILQELVKRTISEKQNDRKRSESQDRPMKRVDAERDELIHAFYCSYCRKDFLSKSQKRIVRDGMLRAWYQARCECGKDVLRRQTEKPDDEYYNLSEEVRIQRQAAIDDTLAPFQNRFRLLYGDNST